MTAGNTLFGSKLFGQLADDVGLRLCDVGSRGGALEDFIPAAAFTDVLGFEPERAECQRLNQVAAQLPKTWKAERHVPVALGDRDASIELIVCNDPFYSSTLEPVERLPAEFGREQDFRVVDRLQMEVQGLDNFCSKNGVTDLDFLKVDVQGGELAILQGGAGLVSQNLLGIRCEVEFAHLYVGQPLFSEMEMHLRKSGFYPADWLYERHWRSDPRIEHSRYCRSSDIPYSRGRLIHSDVLFLRDHHWVRENMQDPDAKLCRLILIALLYHQLDLAATVLPLVQTNQVVRSASPDQWRHELGIVSKTLAKIALRRVAGDWFTMLRRLLRR